MTSIVSDLNSQLSASGASVYSWVPGRRFKQSGQPNAGSQGLSTTTHFVVQGTSANGCYAYDSVTVTVTKTGQNAFSVPNAFTPNNDGINDWFWNTQLGRRYPGGFFHL